MGYAPRVKSFRGSGRGFVKLRGDKGRAARRKRSGIGSRQDDKLVVSLKEVSEKTLQLLHNLGSQKFGCSPFSEYFDRWLSSLSNVLNEFELSPSVSLDGEFLEERSRIFSGVEFELLQRRNLEASFENTIRSLPENRNLLARFKDEYAVKARELKARKKAEIKRLYSKIDGFRGQLDEIVHLKTGFFRGISRKDREQKEAATIQELNAAQRELEFAMMDFDAEQKRLKEEYEGKWLPVLEQIRDCQKKTEILEIDGSLEERWFACEALVDAVNALLQRKSLQLNNPE
jgi:hypothetical protein